MTKKEKHQLINERLSNLSLTEAIKQFTYLDGGKVKPFTIKQHWEKKTLGSLLRQLDKPRHEVFINAIEK